MSYTRWVSAALLALSASGLTYAQLSGVGPSPHVVQLREPLAVEVGEIVRREGFVFADVLPRYLGPVLNSPTTSAASTVLTNLDVALDSQLLFDAFTRCDSLNF